jgi:hypothetical protein
MAYFALLNKHKHYKLIYLGMGDSYSFFCYLNGQEVSAHMSTPLYEEFRVEVIMSKGF